MSDDLNRFIEQNPLTMAGFGPNDDLDAMEEYVTHHAGGLVVLLRHLGDGRCVKLHDSWSDEEGVVVHTYDPDYEGERPDGDPHEDMAFYDNGTDALSAFMNAGATYHGIVKVECLICGYVTTNVTTMEMWNDYGSTCMEENHERGATRWTLKDGTVRVVTQNTEGDLAHYTEEQS
jgi:hypothetical protein